MRYLMVVVCVCTFFPVGAIGAFVAILPAADSTFKHKCKAVNHWKALKLDKVTMCWLKPFEKGSWVYDGKEPHGQVCPVQTTTPPKRLCCSVQDWIGPANGQGCKK